MNLAWWLDQLPWFFAGLWLGALSIALWYLSRTVRDHGVELGLHRTQLRTINGERKERLTAALVARRPRPTMWPGGAPADLDRAQADDADPVIT